MVNYLDYLDEEFNIRSEIIEERYKNVILFYWNDIYTMLDNYLEYLIKEKFSVVKFNLEMDEFKILVNQNSLKEFMIDNVFCSYILESKSSIFYNDYWSEFSIFATKLSISESERDFCTKKYKNSTEWLRDKGHFHWDKMARKYKFY